MKRQLDQVYNEIKIWERMDHKNIVKIFELLDDRDQDFMYLVMIFCDYGQIMKFNEKSQEFEVNQKIWEHAWSEAEMKYFD